MRGRAARGGTSRPGGHDAVVPASRRGVGAVPEVPNHHHNPLNALYPPTLALTSPTASQPQGKTAAPASLRERPPTCENAGRDDRI